MSKPRKADRLPPIEKIREHFKDKLTPEIVEAAVRKSEQISLRVTPADKALMRELAKECRCTITELLTALARLAGEKLPRGKRPLGG